MHTHFIFSILHPAIIFAALFISDYAVAINKCVVNGSTTYTDQPCPAEANASSFTQQIIPPNDPAAAQQRYLADQKKLNQINQKKAQDEKQQERDAKSLAQQNKLAKEKEYKCKNLDLKRRATQQRQAILKHNGTKKQAEQS